MTLEIIPADLKSSRNFGGLLVKCFPSFSLLWSFFKPVARMICPP